MKIQGIDNPLVLDLHNSVSDLYNPYLTWYTYL